MTAIVYKLEFDRISLKSSMLISSIVYEIYLIHLKECFDSSKTELPSTWRFKHLILSIAKTFIPTNINR